MTILEFIFKILKCIRQMIGINKFGTMPKLIGKYLNFSKHRSLWHSSAMLLANSGIILTTWKRFGGWTSSTVAEGYIHELFKNKEAVSILITS